MVTVQSSAGTDFRSEGSDRFIFNSKVFLHCFKCVVFSHRQHDRGCCVNEGVCKIFRKLHLIEGVFVQDIYYLCESSRLQGLQSIKCIIQERIFELHVSIEDSQLSRNWNSRGAHITTILVKFTLFNLSLTIYFILN